MEKLIFDLDGTLMDWKDEYIIIWEKTFEELNYHFNKEQLNKINDVIENYENEYNTYTNELFIENITKNFNIELPNNFVEIFTKYAEKYAYEKIAPSIIDTLKYLKNKYKLVVLSNWFGDCQNRRLKQAGLYEYFDEFYYSDKELNKPNKEAFIRASDGDVSNSIMIGDSYTKDIKGALDIGMKAIMMDKNNKYETNNEFKVIRKLEDLKGIL